MKGENKSERHADYSHDWWTPDEWMHWVHVTLGDFHDPCSRAWQPSHPSGLDSDWGKRFYCNHPGARGSTLLWWEKFVLELNKGGDGIWCAFSVEQLRHMHPSPLETPGWLVMPRKRIGFVWGGQDTDKRKHGEAGKSPGSWTVFWSSVEPAETPIECVVVRTGGAA